MRGQPRPTRRVSEGLGGHPGPPADPDPGGDHPHPTRNRGAGRGPAYRDVRDAFLALVGHGPPPAPSARPVDLWAVLRAVRLSLGPAPRGRGDRAREG